MDDVFEDIFLMMVSIATFLLAISSGIFFLDSSNSYEAAVTNQYLKNSGIFTSVSPPAETIEITGYEVFSDILNTPDGLSVVVENSLLNNIMLPHEKSLLTEARTIDASLLAPYILMSRTYQKEMILDSSGNLTGLSYSISN